MADAMSDEQFEQTRREIRDAINSKKNGVQLWSKTCTGSEPFVCRANEAAWGFLTRIKQLRIHKADVSLSAELLASGIMGDSVPFRVVGSESEMRGFTPPMTKSCLEQKSPQVCHAFYDAHHGNALLPAPAMPADGTPIRPMRKARGHRIEDARRLLETGR